MFSNLLSHMPGKSHFNAPTLACVVLSIALASCSSGRGQTEKSAPDIASMTNLEKARTPPPVDAPAPVDSETGSGKVDALLAQSKRLHSRLNELGWERGPVEQELLALGPVTVTDAATNTRYWLRCSAKRCGGLYVVVDPAENEAIEDCLVVDVGLSDSEEGFHGYALLEWRSRQGVEQPETKVSPEGVLDLSRQLKKNQGAAASTLALLFKASGLELKQTSLGGEQESRYYAVDRASCVELYVTSVGGAIGYSRAEEFGSFEFPLENDLYAKCAFAALGAR